MDLAGHESNPVIIHLSDLHWGQDRRINEANGKLALDYLYEDLEGVQERPQSEWPNILVVSGDLTTKYAPKEYFPAKKFIDKIANLFGLPYGNICVVPGNHDVNLPERKVAAGERSLPPYIYEEEFTKKMGGELIKQQPGTPYFWGLYPELRLCIFGFDSNVLSSEDIRNFESDSELFEQCLMAGRIGKEQLDLFETFWNTKAEEISDFDIYTKIAVLHHHVTPIPSEELKAFNILTDAGNFLEKLAKNDIDIIMHGHEHYPFVAGIKYNMVSHQGFREKEMLILGAGSSGTDRLKYEKGFGNHYGIIKINNWNIKTEPIKVDIEWRYNQRNDYKFIPFTGLRPIKLKEKERMKWDQSRLEEARGYKFKKISIDLIIREDGLFEITRESNVVSVARRVVEIEHFFYAMGGPDKASFSKPKIEHIGGKKVKEDAEIGIKDQKSYLYVMPEKPLRYNEETTYKITEKSSFRGFFMSQEDFSKEHTENPDLFFEFFSFQAVRTVDELEIKITFPEKFKKSMKKAPFPKATIGDERHSTSDIGETKRIRYHSKANYIEMSVQDLVYSMNYLLGWYLPEKWPLTRKSQKNA